MLQEKATKHGLPEAEMHQLISAMESERAGKHLFMWLRINNLENPELLNPGIIGKFFF